MATNHRPEIKGTEYAIWNRIKLITFDVSIPKSQRDRVLPERLRKELPGILAWAVQGHVEWLQDGLQEPEEVKAATNSYRKDMDTLARFIDEECENAKPGRGSRANHRCCTTDTNSGLVPSGNSRTASLTESSSVGDGSPDP